MEIWTLPRIGALIQERFGDGAGGRLVEHSRSIAAGETGPTTRVTHSPRARSEGAALVTFCHIYRLLPLGNVAGVPRRKLLTLELGERLCDTYEAYRGCLPRCELEIEELLSFVLGIAENEVVALGRYTFCSGTVIIDRLAPQRPACAHCQRASVSEHASRSRT